MRALFRGMLREAAAEVPAGGAAVVAPPPAPVTPPAEPDPDKVPWLAPKLAATREKATKAEQARILADLGIENLDDAKAAIAARKAATEAEKTATQKALEAGQRADTLDKQLKDTQAAVSLYAEEQMAALTAEQQAAVKAIAGDDASGQLKAIKALKPTWTAPASQAATTTTTPATPPKGTAPKPGPAEASQAAVETDHTKVYQQLKADNPHQAATYLNRYGDKIKLHQ